MSGWRIGRVGGISIEINSSWLLIFALFFYNLGAGVFPSQVLDSSVWARWVAAFVATVLFFSSVVLHELSHSFAARRFGINVSRITLFVFGGVAQVEEEPRRATDELVISLAGPGMSVLLSLVFFGLYWVAGRLGGLGLVLACLQWVAIYNLALAVFNMVPGFPMDGGRVLRALLWYYWGDLLRATRVASVMGQVVGYGLIGLGAYWSLKSGSLWAGAWYIVLGFLLQTVARQAYRRELVQATLQRTPVGQFVVAHQAFQVGTPLTVAAPAYFTPQADGWAPILHGAQLVGVLTRDRIAQVPQWQWGSLTVEQVMEPLREELAIRHSRSAAEAAARMEHAGTPKLMVVDDWGNLQGIVTDASLGAGLSARLRGG